MGVQVPSTAPEDPETIVFLGFSLSKSKRDLKCSLDFVSLLFARFLVAKRRLVFIRRMTILNSRQVIRHTYEEAQESFHKHCVIKNLSEKTINYYKEDLDFFHSKVPVKYIDEVDQEAFDDFIFQELEAGKKVTSLNTRIRGLRVFFKFCVEREYMEPIEAKLMKTDKPLLFHFSKSSMYL